MVRRVALALALTACLTACSRDKADSSAAQQVQAASVAPAQAFKVVITPARAAAAPITISIGDQIEIKAGALSLLGRTKGDKRFYQKDLLPFVEVKSGDAGFKLRTPDSTLLWKVKIADEKIKVSDNEENQNPWVLKTKYDDKVKVLDPSEKEIGEVKLHAESGKAKVKDAEGAEQLVVEPGKHSAAYGVFLMSGVPEEYRVVIAAELLARGH